MHRYIVSRVSTMCISYRRGLYRYTWYFLWWQKSGNNVSLKSGNLPSSPNKLSDNCYGMKFDVLDNQLLRKRHPIAHFNRWVNMGVVCNHVRNAAFKPFKSVHTQATVLQSCQSKLLTTKFLKRCETKQLRTDFIDNLKVMLQKKNGGYCGSGWISEHFVAVQIQVQVHIL